MRYTALFLIAALAVSSAYVVSEAEFDITPALIESEASRPNFGDVVELLETSEGLAESVKDRILKFMNDYVENLKKEAHKQDELHAKNQQECAEEEKFRTKEIEDGEKSAAASYNHRETCQANLNLARSIYEQGKANLQEVTAMLKNAHERRAGEAELNKRNTKNLNKAVSGVEICLKLLNELEASVNGRPKAFIQEVNALLAISISTGHHEHMIPVYESLVEMNANGGITSADVAKVRSLLDTQLKNFESAIKDVATREAKQQKDYEAEVKDLEAAIARLQNQIVKADKQVDAMEGCVKQESGIFDMATQKVKRNKELLAHSIAICDADNRAYEAAVANRIREMRLIVQLEKAMVHLAKRYLAATLPKVGKVINLVKTKGDTVSKREQYRVCHILKVHNIQDADCDKLQQDITV